MSLQPSQLTAPSNLETSASEGLDWKYPLLNVTMAFLFIGFSAVLRLLPIRKLLADLLAVAVVIAWQYGLHRAKIAPWDSDGSRAIFSTVSQWFLNLVTTFVLFMTVFFWTEGGPTINNAMMAAFVSFFIVFTKFRSKASRSHSANT
jgi:glycerol uptake facilitator-like aquaporin